MQHQHSQDIVTEYANRPGNVSLGQGRDRMKRSRLLTLFLIMPCLLLSINMAQAEESKYEDEKILVKNLVDEAVRVIDSEGEAGVKAIADTKGRFNTKDAYVFVTSETGADLVNPAFKDIEGLPLEAYVNPITKAAQATIVNAVKDKDEAWVEYFWPKPGEAKPSQKISYLKKMIINGRVRIIGAGFYPGE